MCRDCWKDEVERRAPIDIEGEDLARLVISLEEEMREAAKDLRFEYAARLRDDVNELKTRAARGRRGALALSGRSRLSRRATGDKCPRLPQQSGARAWQ